MSLSNRRVLRSHKIKTDLYGVLGIEKTATQKDIKKKYYKLALEYHPDKNKEFGAKKKFQDITRAYKILSNENKRKKYDEYGEDYEDSDDEFGEMADEDEAAEWTAPDFAELTKAFNSITEDEMKMIQGQVEWNESLNKSNVWSDDVLSKELERAKKAGQVYLEYTKRSINSIPPNIGDYVALQRLNLHNNKIGELPDSIVLLVNLKVLDVSVNRLTELPGAMNKMKSLEILNLDHNSITELPSGLFELENITSVSAFANKLTKLPETANSCKSLKYFYLELNPIEKVSSLMKRKELKFLCDDSVVFIDKRRSREKGKTKKKSKNEE